MYLIKKRVFISALMVILTVAMVSTPAIAQENTEQSEPTLSGKIVNTATQKALSGIEVNIKGLEQTATTDKEGKYTFDSLMAGTYTVTVKADGFQDWQKEVKVTQEGKKLNIELKPTEVG